MNITIQGRNCTPRESFKNRAERKLSKIDRFFDKEADAKVVATAEKSYKTVEVTVNNNGMIYRAQAKGPDMEEELDKAVDTIIRQIRKNKTRLEKRLKSGAFDEYAAAEEVPEETEFEVVRTKHIVVKPQSVEEAILQMNQLDHKFYVFLNSATDSLAVVYKRDDGGYGLIEPAEE